MATLCLALGCPGARADEGASQALAYGLDCIVAHRGSPDMMTVTVTPVTVKDRLLYVADFYGDNLIYFTLKKTQSLASGQIQLSLQTIDGIVSSAALGTIAKAGKIRSEKDAIVLEASEEAAALEEVERAESKKLSFYRHAWTMPLRKVLKKSRSKAQATAQSIASRLSGED